MKPDRTSKHAFGKSGEEIALAYLKKKRYRLVERNFRIFKGEIDIIAYDRETLVFIEVKSRTGTAFGLPEEAVTPHKQQQLRKVASGYLAQHNLMEAACRFDVVSIVFDERGKYCINHIKNAF
ncbi:MAG: YraN family protein [Candidatus Aminicenantales bacterium]